MALTETWLQQVIDQEVEGVELVMLEQVGGRQQKVVRLVHRPCGRRDARAVWRGV